MHQTFAQCINTLCINVDPTTAMLDLQSPMYVLGDIHGNYKDLNYLSKNIVQVGFLLGLVFGCCSLAVGSPTTSLASFL